MNEIDAWPTPMTSGGIQREPLTTPDNSNHERPLGNSDGRAHIQNPLVTPTPSRFRDAMENPDISGSSNLSHDDYEITKEVMGLLRDKDIGYATSSSIRHILNQYALKTLGITRGRDITRLALKSKDTKIAELQQRITALEAERERNRAIVGRLMSDMAQSFDDMDD